jgi:endonuclease YncB( thermonuclease family)
VKRLIGTLFLLLAVIAPAWADTMSGIVIVVIDGDTVLFKPDSPYQPDAHGAVTRAFLKIRLANIDAPEKDQPYGEAATRALSELVLHQRVEVTTVAIDVYGRTIARIQQDAVQVNTELVRRGMAWSSNYRRNAELKAVQRDAQQASRGLWQETAPVPPWVWRRAHPATAY